MKLKALTVALVLATMAIGSVRADIDPLNPDWVIYRDTYGSTTADYYDNYQQVAQGETFLLHVVTNRNPPGGTGYQIRDFISAFWYDSSVVENFPVPVYDYAWPANMGNPAAPQFTANGYVQLTNWNIMGSVQSMWEGSAEAPYVLISWELTIRADATIGTSTLPMRLRTYDINGSNMEANSVESDPVFTIEVIPGFSYDPWDFNQDGSIAADDVDILCANMGGDPATYDMDGDNDVDEDDMIYHVENYLEYDSDGDGAPDGQGTFRGDFNTDGQVNGTDLSLMNGSFGGSAGFAGGNANCDTTVNGTDLSILASVFGNVVTAAVPEPMTMGLLSLGGLALLRRRK